MSRNSHSTNDTGAYVPLFERFDADDFPELQNCKAAISNLQNRIEFLEKLNVDLEDRLEKQAKEAILLNRKIHSNNVEWEKQSNKLSEQILALQRDLEVAHSKNASLRDNNTRIERELYGLLQRKYEILKGPARPLGGGNPGMGMALDPQPGKRIEEETTLQQVRAPQDARQKKMTSNLSEFLGL